MILEKAIAESCKYERAYQRLDMILRTLNERKKSDDAVDLKEGDKPDESYDLMIEAFTKLRNEWRAEANRLWNMAESKAEYKPENVEALCNAVVLMAVQDYEMAISGAGNQSEKTLIELFADSCDSGEAVFTKLKVNVLLEKVRAAHEKFVEICKKHGTEIVAETKAMRANKKFNAENLKKDGEYKCPLCGGGLYDEIQYGVHRIVCTDCYLSHVVKTDKKKVYRGYKRVEAT